MLCIFFISSFFDVMYYLSEKRYGSHQLGKQQYVAMRQQREGRKCTFLIQWWYLSIFLVAYWTWMRCKCLLCFEGRGMCWKMQWKYFWMSRWSSGYACILPQEQCGGNNVINHLYSSLYDERCHIPPTKLQFWVLEIGTNYGKRIFFDHFLAGIPLRISQIVQLC